MDNKCNCYTCLYKDKINSDGSIDCDKKVLLTGKIVHIETDKVDKSCPCHSIRFIEETRYYLNNKDMRYSYNSCSICGRLYDDMDENNYEEETWEIDGKTINIRRCRICIDKGRSLFEEEEK